MWQYAIKQYAELQEQFTVIQETMAPLRLTRYELAVLTLRKAWHDLVLSLQEWRQETSSSAQCLVIASAVLIAALVLDASVVSRLSSLRRHGLPVLKCPKGVNRWDYKALLEEGARKYPNRPYIITYSGYEYVVYPSSSWDEVKRLPAAQASMLDWFTHVFFQGWRFLGQESSSLYRVIGVDLARAVPSYVRERQEDARKAFDRAMGQCDEWTSIPLFPVSLEIIAATNATGLVGPELGTDPRWLKATRQFPMAIMIAVFSCHAVPRLLRPVVSLVVFIPAWLLYFYMMKLLHPVVARDLQQHEAAASGEEKKKKGKENLGAALPSGGRFPVTQWLVSRYRDGEASARRIAHDLIVASFESTGSMAGTLYFIIAELVSRPELVEQLRQELSQTLLDGYLPQTHLGELQMLDSVMRESSRVNPFSYLALYRRLRQPVQLAIGPRLPSGSLICVDALHITASEALWEDAETFDPMRFLKLRQQTDSKSRHQFTSLGADSPGWGDGLQACPGRVFAGNTLKIVLAHLLINYDIRLPPDAGKPGRNSMPNGSMAPDQKAMIMIRKRTI